jgi:hypothetical protein
MIIARLWSGSALPPGKARDDEGLQRDPLWDVRPAEKRKKWRGPTPTVLDDQKMVLLRGSI